MSAPVTHLVLAQKVFARYFSDCDPALFFVGTSFPDIRRIGKIPRERVHDESYSLAKIQSLDSFTAGLKFHSVVDLVSQQYSETSGFYDLFTQNIFTGYSAKLFADRILKTRLVQWPQMTGYFNHVYPEEFVYGVDQPTVRQWHRILTAYFTSDIEKDQTTREFIIANGTPEKYIDEVIKAITPAGNYSQAEKLILKFYTDFENLIDKS
jgi:hypothetical protein